MVQSHTISDFRPAVDAAGFTRLSSTRLLVIGGIGLILAGLVFGDIFAVFVLHQNANHIGERLMTAIQAVAAGDANAVMANFTAIGSLLENRGTKVDTHVHIIDFGYLALLLAILQPYVALEEGRRKQLASWFIIGAVLLPTGVFTIHYVGLKYSPLQSIGWASIVADLGGLFVFLALCGIALGLVRYACADRPLLRDHALLSDRSWSARVLLAGGSLLILTGFVYGAWYSAIDLYRMEAREPRLLASIVDNASAGATDAAAAAVSDFGLLQGERAVKIAAHSHFIEFGILAMLLAFIQPYVYLSEAWRRRWTITLLAGSVILPVFVWLELPLGLFAGGIADFGGLLVAIALVGMLTGVLRYTGRLDAQEAQV